VQGNIRLGESWPSWLRPVAHAYVTILYTRTEWGMHLQLIVLMSKSPIISCGFSYINVYTQYTSFKQWGKQSDFRLNKVALTKILNYVILCIVLVTSCIYRQLMHFEIDENKICIWIRTSILKVDQKRKRSEYFLNILFARKYSNSYTLLQSKSKPLTDCLGITK